jgi:hypothetical protein
MALSTASWILLLERVEDGSCGLVISFFEDMEQQFQPVILGRRFGNVGSLGPQTVGDGSRAQCLAFGERREDHALLIGRPPSDDGRGTSHRQL